jgi:hypothetical protein
MPLLKPVAIEPRPPLVDQWNMERIGASLATSSWDLSTGANTVVSVCSTGLRLDRLAWSSSRAWPHDELSLGTMAEDGGPPDRTAAAPASRRLFPTAGRRRCAGSA